MPSLAASVFLLLAARTAAPSGIPPSASLSIPMQAVCNVLDIGAEQCAADHSVSVLGLPSGLELSTPLELVRSIPTSRGRQLTLRCSHAACSPFVVIVRGVALSGSSPSLWARSPGRANCPIAAGTTVRYLDQSDAMRVTLPVVALERGCIGRPIRVRELLSHRIFRGTLAPSLDVIATKKESR